MHLSVIFAWIFVGSWHFVSGTDDANSTTTATAAVGAVAAAASSATSTDAMTPTSTPMVFCDFCAVEDDEPEIRLTVDPAYVPAISTIYTIINSNGTTTSTYVNNTASSIIAAVYSIPGDEGNPQAGGLFTGNYSNEFNTIVDIHGPLEYGYVSFYSNGSSTCMYTSTGFAITAPIIYTDDAGFDSQFSEYLTQAFSGTPPSDCQYQPTGQPTYQIPAQYLTTTVQINNLPAVQPSSTPSPTMSAPMPGSIAQTAAPTTGGLSIGTVATNSGSGSDSIVQPTTSTVANSAGVQSPASTTVMVVPGATVTCSSGSGPGPVINTAFGGQCSVQNSAAAPSSTTATIVIDGSTTVILGGSPTDIATLGGQTTSIATGQGAEMMPTGILSRLTAMFFAMVLAM